MCRRSERNCAMLTRFRRSPTSKAFAGSNGQIAGVIASAPFASESRIASVLPGLLPVGFREPAFSDPWVRHLRCELTRPRESGEA